MSSRLLQNDFGEVSSPIAVESNSYDCKQYGIVCDAFGSEYILQNRCDDDSKEFKSSVHEERKKVENVRRKSSKIRKYIKLMPFLSVTHTELSVRRINELLGLK